MRARALALGLTALLVLGACGGDDDAAAPTAAGAGDRGSVEQLAERSGLDPVLVMDVVCDAWVTEAMDQPTVNEYVRDLLLPLDLVNSPDRPAYGREDIDHAVFEHCETHEDDPASFVAAVLERLDLTEADLEDRIAAACDRYATQQRRIAAGDWSGEDIASMIRTLISERGLELARLQAAIAGVCA